MMKKDKTTKEEIKIEPHEDNILDCKDKKPSKSD